MANIINYNGLILSNRATGKDTECAYVRPADWLALPTLVDGDEKVVGLFAVYNGGSNFVAFQVNGAFTVDWGDGSAAENFSSGAIAQHNLNYSGVNPDTLSSRGYRQAIITITPQAGQHITSLYFDKKHDQTGLGSYRTPWLDIAVASQNLSKMYVSGTNGSLPLMEQFRIVGSHGITSLGFVFYNCDALETVSIDTQNVTNMAYTFAYCNSLKWIDFDTKNVTNMNGTFFGNNALHFGHDLNTVKVTNMASMYSSCACLIGIPAYATGAVTDMSSMFSYSGAVNFFPDVDTSNVENMGSMFFNNSALQAVPNMNVAKCTNFASMFSGCPSLSVGKMAGTINNISYSGCKLSREEIVDIFNGLGIVAGKHITISNNWGLSSLTAADRLIATNKGWVIVE